LNNKKAILFSLNLDQFLNAGHQIRSKYKQNVIFQKFKDYILLFVYILFINFMIVLILFCFSSN